MMVAEPETDLDHGFSSADAAPTPWPEAQGLVAQAEVFWLSTVRPDGRPHVTPLIAVWLDGALYFVTGRTERKARNLEHNPHVILTTGRNALAEGLDVVLEGDAERVTEGARLQRLADAYLLKYGDEWAFDVRDDSFYPRVDPEAGEAWVFEVRPNKAFAFGRGETYSQTRYRF